LGKDYFYQLLKPLADQSTVVDEEYIDWGQDAEFVRAIGIGECAGVILDLVAVLFTDSEEKLHYANLSLQNNAYADSIFHSYSVFVNTAKALLLDKEISSSTQIGIINEFQKSFVETGDFGLDHDFPEMVLQINKHEPSAEFAKTYFEQAQQFLKLAKTQRVVEVG
jgi:sulfite reductase (ferredoxin)